jgi:hypothetical protein
MKIYFLSMSRSSRDIIDLEDLSLTANSLNYDRLNWARAMDLDPPYLVQKKIMVGILLSAPTMICATEFSLSHRKMNSQPQL